MFPLRVSARMCVCDSSRAKKSQKGLFLKKAPNTKTRRKVWLSRNLISTLLMISPKLSSIPCQIAREPLALGLTPPVELGFVLDGVLFALFRFLRPFPPFLLSPLFPRFRFLPDRPPPDSDLFASTMHNDRRVTSNSILFQMVIDNRLFWSELISILKGNDHFLSFILPYYVLALIIL